MGDGPRHDRAVDDPLDDPLGGDLDPDAAAPRGFRGAYALGRGRVDAGRSRAEEIFERYRENPLVDIALSIYQRDKDAAGTVVSSAVAFRLFLFFVPMLLFVVGMVGLFSDLVTPAVVDEARITGNVAQQIDGALDQKGSGRWIAALAGLTGMATTGRTLAKALSQASCLAWQLPVSAKASIRTIGVVVGLIVGVGLTSMLTNRLNDQFGVGVAGLSYTALGAVYTVVFWLLYLFLPRSPSDRSALLPGALLVGATIASLQALSQLYLPSRFERASELYGTIGVTVVILGWFFIMGRVIVLAMTINACVFERFGSITEFIFSLPVLRGIPRRWPSLARAFGLDIDAAAHLAEPHRGTDADASG
jgi:membrane protein